MNFRFASVAMFVCVVVGSLAGCASVPMKPSQFEPKANESQALVTFVRESIWMGDGIHLYLWDGETFVGTLSAGTLVQYKVAPGPHVFMANAENWSYVRADLQPGKHYFIKANMFPGFATMRSALTPVKNDDPRVDTWPTRFPTKEVIPEKIEQYVLAKKADVAAALTNFNSGSVTFAEMKGEHAR